jgi:hypothetical protein
MSYNQKIPRDFRVLAKRARAAGWTITALGSGHLRWRSPSGQVVTSSESPSDRRAYHTLRCALRRAGLLLQRH